MRKIDLSADIAGIRVDSAIGNASGILSYIGSINELSKYLGFGVLKTTGEEERQGNETPIFCIPSPGCGLNAVGLPDPGYEEIEKELENSERLIPIFSSVSGKTEENIAKVIRRLNPYVDGHEMNCSCPNVKKEEKLGVTIGYEPERVRAYARAARESTDKPILLKPPPAQYMYDRDKFLYTIEAGLNEGADGLILINTIPGGMKIDIYAESPVLSAKYGGVSGRAIKPIGVGCVYTCREAFPGIPITAVGGIESAADIVEYSMAGADAFQVGTAFYNMNTEQKRRFLAGLARETELLVEKLGYTSLRDMRGRAHGKR